MAPRPLLVPMMAALLLLLSHLPSAPASFMDPLEQLFKASPANATAPSSSPAAAAASTNTSSGSPATAPPPPKPKVAEDPKAKAEREKQVQQLKELEAESAEYAKAHHIVSPTNGTGSYKGMAREFLSGHNAARARYGVPPMRWEKKLARHARRWANAMRNGCHLQHSPVKYGESVYRTRGTWNATAMDAVNSWAEEEPIYDRATGKCTAGHSDAECGHFALMVGKRYQRIGCARAECFKGGVFMSCNYFTYDLPEPED